MTQKNLFFGYVCLKFSLRVLLSFCLVFCQYKSGVAYKSVAYKSVAYKKKLVIDNCTSLSIFNPNILNNEITQTITEKINPHRNVRGCVDTYEA